MVTNMDTLGINSLTNYASDLAAKASTEAMQNKAKSAETDEELMEACKEFENYLWEQVLKSMKATAGFDEDAAQKSQTVQYFMDTAISDVAKKMTDTSMGPNSLAMQMYEQMKRNNAVDIEKIFQTSNNSIDSSDN